MPPRIVQLAIVCFWLATLAWWAERDLLPQWRGQAAPAFIVELADEAVPQTAVWTIYRGQEKIGRQQTRVEYRSSDSFAIESSVSELRYNTPLIPFEILIPEWRTITLINRAGRLQGMTSHCRLETSIAKAEFDLVGKISGEELLFEGKFRAGNSEFAQTFDPVPLPTGNALSPLQPIPRIRGLTPGRTWTMTQIDPLGEVMQALARQLKLPIKIPNVGGSSPMVAHVAEETVVLITSKGEYSCYLIEYRGENTSAKTWVRIDDGKVLRQEAQQGGEILILERVD